MQKLLFILLFLPFVSSAQTDTLSIKLKPIERYYGKYTYGNQLLRNKDALEIPLTAINDPDVNLHFVRFRRYTNFGQIVQIVPTLYFVSYLLGKNRTPSVFYQKTYRNAVLGAQIASIGLNVLGLMEMRKAVKSYNNVLKRRQSMGYLNLTPSEENLGVSMKYNF